MRRCTISSTDEWENEVISLYEYNGQTILIGFYFEANEANNDKEGFYVDNVWVGKGD